MIFSNNSDTVFAEESLFRINSKVICAGVHAGSDNDMGYQGIVDFLSNIECFLNRPEINRSESFSFSDPAVVEQIRGSEILFILDSMSI